MKNQNLQLVPAAILALILGSSFVGAAYAQITPLADSFTNTADPTTNYGTSTLLYVNGADEITYIQFNLASIPTTATINQATLKLYVNSVTTAGSLDVDYVNGAWSESTIDASNEPALGGSIASGVSITTADKNQYILVNVTSAVQAWLSGAEKNDGIALVANGAFNATFDSKENTGTSHPAELDIAYAGGDGTITGVTTASGSGLAGGGTNGTLNLSLTDSCSSGQILQWNGSAWACIAATGTGTITGVTAGTDLTGGGTSGNVTLNLNKSALNSVYPQLGANNTFTGTQTINNVATITGTNGAGVLQVTNTATSGANPGIVGTTDSTNASGVKGVASASTGTTNGVYGSSASSSGYGVQGSSSNIGVYGTSSNLGVYGASSSASETGQSYGHLSGVWGDTGNGRGVGVLGTADGGFAGFFVNNSGGASALSGLANSTTEYGAVAVKATAVCCSNEESTVLADAGVWGDTGAAAGQSAGIVGTADDNSAGDFFNNSSTNPTLYLVNDGGGGTGAATIVTHTASGTCSIGASGDVACTGKVASVVPTEGGARKVSLYAMQSPENWFEDAGSGALSNGSTRVDLDPIFAQTVNTALEYHVFLTPNGDCNGLYVSQKTPTSFEVHELGGGRSSIAFDYRIMAKRSGYENVRLTDVTTQYQQMEEQRKARRGRNNAASRETLLLPQHLTR